MLIDNKLTAEYGDLAIRWLGRTTSLTGMFAAAGKFMKVREITAFQSLNEMSQKISQNPSFLDLASFEKMRNSVELAKVNIGNVNKKAVFDAIFDLLTEKTTNIRWNEYFNKSI